MDSGISKLSRYWTTRQQGKDSSAVYFVPGGYYSTILESETEGREGREAGEKAVRVNWHSTHLEESCVHIDSDDVTSGRATIEKLIIFENFNTFHNSLHLSHAHIGWADLSIFHIQLPNTQSVAVKNSRKRTNNRGFAELHTPLRSRNFSDSTYQWPTSDSLTQWKHCSFWISIAGDSVYNMGANILMFWYISSKHQWLPTNFGILIRLN